MKGYPPHGQKLGQDPPYQAPYGTGLVIADCIFMTCRIRDAWPDAPNSYDLTSQRAFTDMLTESYRYDGSLRYDLNIIKSINYLRVPVDGRPRNCAHRDGRAGPSSAHSVRVHQEPRDCACHADRAHSFTECPGIHARPSAHGILSSADRSHRGAPSIPC